MVAPIAVALVALIAVGGSRLPVQTTARPQALSPGLGRTSSVCTVPQTAGETASTPGAIPTPGATPTPGSTPSSGSTPTGTGSAAQVLAVNARLGTGGAGRLSATGIGSTDSSPVIDISARGTGKLLRSPQGSLVLNAEGSMSDSSAGVVYQRSDTGQNRGLELGPCVVPGVDLWLSGLGGTNALRSNLILTNPDATDAVVDLRIYGEDGPVSAAGASGLTIPANGSRTVSLADLIDTAGSIAVNVRASTGRVGAMAEDIRTSGEDPGGADFHPGSARPARRQVIPGIPGGQGVRTLHLVNPGQQRANVKLQVFGPDGPFAPAGAASVTLGAQSTATLDVTDGLAKQIGTIALSSDQPVTATVRSISQSSDSAADLAVSTAQPRVARVSLAPLAIATDATNQLAISNAADSTVTVSLQLFDLNGVSLYTEDVPIAPHATAARQLTQPGPAYLVLRVPSGAQVYAGVTEASRQDSVAGLAAAALISPDLAGRGTVVLSDPQVAR